MTIEQPENIIEVRNLCNRFGTHVVHENLDLDIRKGEILSIVGGSGTGKSVLLRSIVGLSKPSAGSVRCFGEDLMALPKERQSQLERRFGVLFQQGALYSSQTVKENVAMPLIEQAGLQVKEAEKLAIVYLSLAGLSAEVGDKYPASLSGGMVKRVALARALTMSPDILFLDEPTAGLDPISAASFDKLIVTMRDALELTVFMITHDLDTLNALSDRIAVISQKKVLITDTVSEVSKHPDPWIQAYFHGPRGRNPHESLQDIMEID